jgi:hypothetical protein
MLLSLQRSLARRSRAKFMLLADRRGARGRRALDPAEHYLQLFGFAAAADVLENRLEQILQQRGR